MPQLLLVPPLALLLEVVGRSWKAWWWWVVVVETAVGEGGVGPHREVETEVGEGHSPVAALSGCSPWVRSAACVSVSPRVLLAVLVLDLLGCLAPQLGVLREQRLRGPGQFLRRLQLQLQYQALLRLLRQVRRPPREGSSCRQRLWSQGE